MSEKIDYETFLPARKDREYYVMTYDGMSYVRHEVLLNTGEMLFGVIICEFKGTVNRIVYEEGGKYLGIGVIHA